MAEYLATDNARQRTRVICAAKFPRKVEVAAYSQVRTALRRALPAPGFDREGLSRLADTLAAKARREAGYARDEALRCERAVRSFLQTFGPRTLNRVEIEPAPRNLAMALEGVRIKVSLDALLTESNGETTCAGGIVLLYAFSSDRSAVAERLSTAAGLMLWSLESGQMEPLPRLCMAADLAEHNLVRASASHSRFRSRVQDSCHEIAARWDAIAPPPDYDGPDWT